MNEPQLINLIVKNLLIFYFVVNFLKLNLKIKKIIIIKNLKKLNLKI